MELLEGPSGRCAVRCCVWCNASCWLGRRETARPAMRTRSHHTPCTHARTHTHHTGTSQSGCTQSSDRFQRADQEASGVERCKRREIGEIVNSNFWRLSLCLTASLSPASSLLSQEASAGGQVCVSDLCIPCWKRLGGFNTDRNQFCIWRPFQLPNLGSFFSRQQHAQAESFFQKREDVAVCCARFRLSLRRDGCELKLFQHGQGLQTYPSSSLLPRALRGCMVGRDARRCVRARLH